MRFIISLLFLVSAHSTADVERSSQFDVLSNTQENTVRVYLHNISNLPGTANLDVEVHTSYKSFTPFVDVVSVMPGKTALTHEITFEELPADLSTAVTTMLYEIPGVQRSDKPIDVSLPCGCEVICRISAGAGDFFHTGWLKHAVDFDLPEGTPFHAIQDGVVVDVKDQGGSNCRHSLFRCQDSLNKIITMSTDGVLIEYLHIKNGGSLVELGDSVVAGDLIGFSGNTGFSSGPHLHVAAVAATVDATVGLMQTTLPMRFFTRQGLINLDRGRAYIGASCQGPAR